MKDFRILLPALLVAVFCFSGSCLTKNLGKQNGGGNEAASAKDTQVIQGMVRIYGSEPHTLVGIASNGKMYAVYPPEKEMELRELQGRLIEFTVRFLDPPQGYGSLFLQDGCVEVVSWKAVAAQ
jgi:hypothetical protein